MQRRLQGVYGQERDAIERQIHITATCGNKALAGRERTRDLVRYVTSFT